LVGPASQRALAAVIAALGLGSIAPLLAWVYNLGAFATWFWLTTVPGFLFMAVVAAIYHRRGEHRALLIALSAGVLGGVIATLVYDVVRMPFLVVGYRLFAPINSYGILMTGAPTGSPFTDTLGWTYNFLNGTGFGIAYSMIALGRRWWLAIPFALGLETMTIVTPYADVYGLRGHLDVIAIAYGAHVFYGAVLGRIVEQAGRWHGLDDGPVPTWWVMAGTVLALVVLGHPWSTASYLAPAAAVRPQPAAVVRAGVFTPEWLRVGVGGCVTLANRDKSAYRLGSPPGAVALAAGSSHRYCFPNAGIQRVQLNQVPYSGGWVIVDPSVRPGA
jgi:hypothetical protein